MENINAQTYTFNRFVTALHESIQGKAKRIMMRGQLNGSTCSYSVPLNTHIGQFSRNDCQVSHDRQRPKAKKTADLMRAEVRVFVSNASKSGLRNTNVAQVQSVTQRVTD